MKKKKRKKDEALYASYSKAWHKLSSAIIIIMVEGSIKFCQLQMNFQKLSSKKKKKRYDITKRFKIKLILDLLGTNLKIWSSRLISF